MNRRKIQFLAAFAMLASATVSQAQIDIALQTTRTYRQHPEGVVYRATNNDIPLGTFTIGLADGSIEINGGCALNGSPTWFGPAPLLGCETGATGYIVGGDINEDGVRDDFSYWEVISVTRSVGFEPSRPELCKLLAAPPSKLPRPIGAFIDGTIICYFNVMTDATVEFKLPQYYYQRLYDARNSMDRELPPGRYEFTFPRLNSPNTPVTIPINYYPIPEGYIEKNNVRQGFRFTKFNGKPLQYDLDGFLNMDPRLINIIEWDGNDAGTIFPAGDNLYFSIPQLAAPPGSAYRDVPPPPAGFDSPITLFPGTLVPGRESRVILPNAMERTFVIPPGMMTAPGVVGYLPVLMPAQEGVFQVVLDRSAPTSQVTTDISQRTYQMPVRLVNTFEGWAAVAFKAGTAPALRVRSADPDNDGFTNQQEWLANRDPMSAASRPPAPPPLTLVQGRSTRSTVKAGTSVWETKHAKALGVPGLVYEYQFSSDLANWRSIGEDDPEWTVIDTETEIKIQSRSAKLSGQGFLRVKMTETLEGGAE